MQFAASAVIEGRRCGRQDVAPVRGRRIQGLWQASWQRTTTTTTTATAAAHEAATHEAAHFEGEAVLVATRIVQTVA